MGGIISRAEQARFLAGDGEEDERAVGAARRGHAPRRARPARRMPLALSTAPLQIRSGPSVAADAEMVPMGGVEHIFVGVGAPGQDADHVVRGGAADPVVDRDRGAAARSGTAWKPALLRGAGERVEVLAARRRTGGAPRRWSASRSPRSGRRRCWPTACRAAGPTSCCRPRSSHRRPARCRGR